MHRFTGDFSLSLVDLQNNKLTQFEASVFQKMLQQMYPESKSLETWASFLAVHLFLDNSAYIKTSFVITLHALHVKTPPLSTDPFDCSPSNVCNFSWLNQSLVTCVRNDGLNFFNARCSNGTAFHELNWKELRLQCPEPVRAKWN